MRYTLIHIPTCALAACVYNTHMNSRDVIEKLRVDGWYLVATKGSHHQFKHPSKPGRVTVVHPSRSFAPGTLRSMERQSGIKLR